MPEARGYGPESLRRELAAAKKQIKKVEGQYLHPGPSSHFIGRRLTLVGVIKH